MVDMKFEDGKEALHTWRCVETNSLKIIIGHKGSVIDTSKNTCDCPVCIVKMEQIEKHQGEKTEQPSTPFDKGKTADEPDSNSGSPLKQMQSTNCNDGGVKDISAEFPEGPKSETQRKDSGPHPSFLPMKCEVCNENDLGLYCTTNVCEECCKKGKCPWDAKCINKHNERRRELVREKTTIL